MIKITYFVHGTTTDNEQGIATGWNQGDLSALGKKQAEELGKLVSKQIFEAFFVLTSSARLIRQILVLTKNIKLLPTTG